MAMRSLHYALVAAIAAASPLTPAAAQQIIPALRDKCWADPRAVQQARAVALAKVRQRRLSEGDFTRHISGCNSLDLIYFNKVAALR